jgi:hypothetical protein
MRFFRTRLGAYLSLTLLACLLMIVILILMLFCLG